MSYLGLNKLSKVYLGTTEIAKIYLGTNLVYRAEPPDPTLIAYWNGADAAISNNWVDRIGNKRWNFYNGYAKGSNYFELDRISNVYRYATLTDNDFGVDYEIKFVVNFELKPDGTNDMIIMDLGGLGVTPAGHWGMFPRYKADNTWTFSVKYNGNNSQTTTSFGTFPVLESGTWTPCTLEFGIEYNESTEKQRAYMKVGEGLITSDWLDKKKIADFIAAGNKATLASSCYQPSGTTYSRTRIRVKTIKVYNVVNQSSGGGDTPSTLPYDAEIEYLQSSGTQYIDTGIKPTTNFKCEIKAQYVQNNNGFDTMVGCYDGTNYGVAVGLQSTSGGNKLYIQFGGGSSFAASNVTTTTALHTFVTQLSNNTLSINVDGTTNTATYSGSLPNMNLFLFARNKSTIGNFSNAKIYYCKIWNGGNLVFDAIPVRVGQVGYMYDRVSRQLIGNAGSGDFALGGDIIGNGAYVRKSYVTSSNPSTMTTNIASVGSLWELDAQYTGSNPSGNLVLICSDDNGAHFFGVTSNGKWGSHNTFEMSVSASTRSTITVEFIENGINMAIGDETLQRLRTTPLAHGQYIHLLGYNNNYKFTGRIYGIKCIRGGTFEVVPAMRISDSVYGLYDETNDVFYTNSFTGA